MPQNWYDMLEPQIKEYNVLNPYPEPQLKGYVSGHNSRNTSNPTFKAITKSLVDHYIKSTTPSCSSKIARRGTRVARHCQLPNRLAGVAYRQAPSASYSTSLQASPGVKVPTARRTRPSNPLFDRPSPGGTTRAARHLQSSALCFHGYRLADSRSHQALYQYSSVFWFMFSNSDFLVLLYF